MDQARYQEYPQIEALLMDLNVCWRRKKSYREAARISKKLLFPKKHSFQLDLKKPSFYTWDFLRLARLKLVFVGILFSWCFKLFTKILNVVSFLLLIQRRGNSKTAFGMCKRSVEKGGDGLRVTGRKTFDFIRSFYGLTVFEWVWKLSPGGG